MNIYQSTDIACQKMSLNYLQMIIVYNFSMIANLYLTVYVLKEKLTD